MDDLNTLRKTVNIYLDLVFKAGLALVILSAFFLFANLTSEIYDTPKFLALLTFTLLMLVLLALRFTIANKVVLIRTPLDIPLVLLIAVAIASTLLSSSPYVALLGNQLRINSSLVSIVGLALFYFVLTNGLKNAKETSLILSLTVIAGQVLAAVTLLSYAGIKLLPDPWVMGPNFTPTGSSFSTAAILALLAPVVAARILSSPDIIMKAAYSLSLTLMGAAIALTGTPATWVAGIFGLGLTFAAISPIRQISHIRPINLICLIIPLVVIALVTALSFVPPIGGAKNLLYDAARNFPREIQLGFIDSWKISVSTFRDSPFWGSGPATYLFDFTNYKPVEFNSSKVWNLRFDQPFNEYLHTLANLGAIGLLALLSLTALFISSAYKTYLTYRSNRSDSEKAALAIAGLAFFLILSLHAATFSVWVVGILILASFMVSNLSDLSHLSYLKSSDIKTRFLQIAANITGQNSAQEIRVEALPGVLLTVILAGVLFTGWFGTKLGLADYHHRLALNAVAQNQGIVAYNELVAAEKLNPYNDVYRTDLAQTNFALANAIALAKGPTEASPAGSLTDQDKQNIQVLLQQSINEGRTAVTLSPKSSINWEILGLLYRQIAGVAQNALIFSLDSYGKAIMQDPYNPALRLSVGGVYYAVQNYDMAIRFFTDSINLKPDFANGYYNLSVALRDKGDLASAQAMAEKVLTLVDQSSPDYKAASDYLNDLKNKITAASPSQPPAAETSGALQDKELPKVIDLPKPERIATPEAIKKPSPTPTPSPTP